MPPWIHCSCCGKKYYPWNIALKSEHKKNSKEEVSDG